MKKVLINVEERELRVAILEDDQLVELYIESLDEKSILNNIYKGRIEGILPGLKAAFVNVGLEKNAFLHFDDVRPDLLWEKYSHLNPDMAETVPSAREALSRTAGEDTETASLVPEAAGGDQDARRSRRGRRGGKRNRRDEDSYTPGLPVGVSADDLEESEDESEQQIQVAEPVPQPVRERPQLRTIVTHVDEDEGRSQPSTENQTFQQSAGESSNRSAAREERQRRRRERWEQKKQERIANRQKHQQEQVQQQNAAFLPPPAGTAPHGSRAAANPYDVFSPYSKPQGNNRRQKNQRWGGNNGNDNFGNVQLRREVRDTRDSQVDFFGPVTQNEAATTSIWDERQPDFDRSGMGRGRYTLSSYGNEASPGNERNPRQGGQGQRQGNNDKRRRDGIPQKRRGGKRRVMKRRNNNNQSYYAARAPKSRPEEKPSDDLLNGQLPVSAEGVAETPKKTRKASPKKAKPADTAVSTDAANPVETITVVKSRATRKKSVAAEAETSAPEAAPLAPITEKAPSAKTTRRKAVAVPEAPAAADEPVTKPASRRRRSVAPEEPAVQQDLTFEAPVQQEAAAADNASETTKKAATRKPVARRGRKTAEPAGETASAEPQSMIEPVILTPASPTPESFSEAPTAELSQAAYQEEVGTSQPSPSQESAGRRPGRRRGRGGRRDHFEANPTGETELQTGAESASAAEPVTSQDQAAEGTAVAPEGSVASAESETAGESRESAGRPDRFPRRNRRGGRNRNGRRERNREERQGQFEGETSAEGATQNQEAAQAAPQGSHVPVAAQAQAPAIQSSREIQQQKFRKRRPPLFPEVFKKGDELMVQVVKEEIGMKGARISTYVSLPGRYLVLLPYPNEEGGVSRKVEDANERKRLKGLLRDISNDETAFIVRTAGVYRPEEDIRQDVQFLSGEWKQIDEKFKETEPTSLVYDDHDILYRLARDVFDENISEIVIDSHTEMEKLKGILGKLIPGLVPKVKLHSGAESIFQKYQVEKQIQKAARRKVWLKSGGYLIIDEAEALTAIDVNTGKSVGKDDQEKLILKTNLEASRAVARELKLRDIGGLIVIDYIDMKAPGNKEQVLTELKAQLRKDRSKTSVSAISEFGLVEMTRKRVRRSLRKTLFIDCPYCQGAGVVLNEQQIWLHIKHDLVHQLEARGRSVSFNVTVNPKIRAYIDQNYRDVIRRLEQKYDSEIRVLMSDAFHIESYLIENAEGDAQGSAGFVPGAAAASGGR